MGDTSSQRRYGITRAMRVQVWFVSISTLILLVDAISRGDILFVLACCLVLGVIITLWNHAPKWGPGAVREDNTMPTLQSGPCPFCGDENAKVETQSDCLGKKYTVRCLTCDATGPSTSKEKRATLMWLWKGVLMRAIEAQDNSAISDALEGYRVLAIYHHQNGGCKFGTAFDVWGCPESVCQEAVQNLIRLIPDPLPDTRQTEPAEETD